MQQEMTEALTIQTSLQEIANLLLLIHESYLQRTSSNEILMKLLDLVEDVGLGNFVTILDVETFRRNYMNASDEFMDYEMFYCWLRDVSVFALKFNFIEGGKRSFHTMLTKYIIPFATKGGKSSVSLSEANTVPKLWIELQETDTWLKYADFVKLLYISMALDENDKLPRLIPIDILWSLVHSPEHLGRNNSSPVHITKILSTFQNIGLSPQLINGQRLTQCINESKRVNGANMNANMNSFSFAEFLKLLELISFEVQLTDYGGADRHRLILLLSFFANRYMSSTLETFYLEQESISQSMSPSTGESNQKGVDVASKMLNSTSIVWLARQSGLISLSRNDVSLPWLFL